MSSDEAVILGMRFADEGRELSGDELELLNHIYAGGKLALRTWVHKKLRVIVASTHEIERVNKKLCEQDS